MKENSVQGDAMQKYDVLISFTDSNDGWAVYRVGEDQYPRDGYEPPEERIAYLSSDKTTFGKPVISGPANILKGDSES